MMKKPIPNDGDLADLISDWLPDTTLRQRVLMTNPARLYSFGEGERLVAAR
jgi:predicted TIM-barrel fold metal-dependent hydrolase